MKWRAPVLLMFAATLTAGCDSVPDASPHAIAPVYDDNTAFTLVAQEIPAGQVDYYLFDFDQGLSVEENASEVLEGLRQNPLGARHLAIIGPDPAHNLAVLTRVAAQNVGTTPSGSTLIYVGPADQRSEVRRLTQPMDVDLRYVVYP